MATANATATTSNSSNANNSIRFDDGSPLPSKTTAPAPPSHNSHHPYSPRPSRLRLPYPVSIELRNVFPTTVVVDVDVDETPQDPPGPHLHGRMSTTTKKKWFRPEYSTKLLHQVQMEIVVKQNDAISASRPSSVPATPVSSSPSLRESEETILYRSVTDDATQPTLYPVWSHLQDHISYADLSNITYQSMKARFSIVLQDHQRPTIPSRRRRRRGDQHHRSSSNDDTIPTTTTSLPFLEIQLHPSKLCRWQDAAASLSSSSLEIPNNHAMTDMLLPLNCILIRFSDQTIRIHPTHYQLLDLQKYTHNKNDHISSSSTHVTTMNNNHTKIPIPDEINDKKRSSGSSNRTFLNNITGSKKSVPLTNNNNNGSFFEDEVFTVLDPPVLSDSTTEIVKDAMVVFRDAASDSLLLPPDHHHLPDDETNDALLGGLGNENVDVVWDEDGNDDDFLVEQRQQQYCSPSSNHVHMYDNPLAGTTTGMENESLRQQIEVETAAFTKEMAQLDQDKTRIRILMDRIRTMENQNVQMEAAVENEVMNSWKINFVLEAQRIRLIRELSLIYPVTVQGEMRYYIRGLEIPTDLYSGNVSEEIISAAFGFLCHLTNLMSKYLGLHIRYKLHCQSSRSAVQDDSSATYPLFPGRQVEREQFEYGVYLLNQNIDCICKGRRIPLPSNIHVLGKILRVYENVKDGY
jgi:hypothetical protein